MPWSAWWQTISTGDLLPLAVAVTAYAAYYLVGIVRLMSGYGPWGCEPPDIEI